MHHAHGSGTYYLNDGKKADQDFNPEFIKKITKTQYALLKKAIKLLKPNCEMVYSTCSIVSCENEDILQKVLNEENIEIVPITLDNMEDIPKLPVKIKGCICIAPNEFYEGFFVAKIRKNK